MSITFKLYTGNSSQQLFYFTLNNEIITLQCNLDYPDLVYPDHRLSGLAGDHYHAYAEGVASDLLWVWSQVDGLCRLAMGKIGLLDYFSEHCWPWSYCISIVFRLGIINQMRKVGTSVIRTFHLSGHFTYPVWQWSACGQRGPDNRGCTVLRRCMIEFELIHLNVWFLRK